MVKEDLKIALYSRLSKDDKDKIESNSITSQKELLKDYVKNNLTNVNYIKEYIDDGYTGLDTNRPSFLGMLEDIKKGDINCVIVKDLSRFGRNSWEVGKYLEQIFPFLNVRFIALNDRLDSKEQNFSNNVIIPFKNMINEAYSRDISQKIRSQFEIKRKQGEFISNFAPYGYKKERDNHNKLIIDENVDWVIRCIYKWKIRGYSCSDIANRLNSIGVLSPMEYKQHIGLNYETVFKTNKKAVWTHISIIRVLSNEIYIGNTIQGKKRTPNLKVKKAFDIPKAQWVKVENTHKNIISKEDFYLVQELIQMDTKKSSNNEVVNIFSGLIKCNDCNNSMVRVTVNIKEKGYYYYVCSSYKYNNKCYSHRISEKKLIKAILFSINEEIKNSEIEQKNSIKEIDRDLEIQGFYLQLKNLKHYIKVYEKYINGLAEVYSKDLIEKNFYLSKREDYKNYIEELKINMKNLKAEIESIKNDSLEGSKFLGKFIIDKYFNELTRVLIVSLIKKISIVSSEEIYIDFQYHG